MTSTGLGEMFEGDSADTAVHCTLYNYFVKYFVQGSPHKEDTVVWFVEDLQTRNTANTDAEEYYTYSDMICMMISTHGILNTL